MSKLTDLEQYNIVDDAMRRTARGMRDKGISPIGYASMQLHSALFLLRKASKSDEVFRKNVKPIVESAITEACEGVEELKRRSHQN